MSHDTARHQRLHVGHGLPMEHQDLPSVRRSGGDLVGLGHPKIFRERWRRRMGRGFKLVGISITNDTANGDAWLTKTRKRRFGIIVR